MYNNVRGRGFQGSRVLGLSDARDSKIPGTAAAAAYLDTKRAVAEAAQQPDTTQGATHLYIYDPSAINAGKIPVPKWLIDSHITTRIGPFINVAGGGDIPRGDEVYVITVKERNVRKNDRKL